MKILFKDFITYLCLSLSVGCVGLDMSAVLAETKRECQVSNSYCYKWLSVVRPNSGPLQEQ